MHLTSKYRYVSLVYIESKGGLMKAKVFMTGRSQAVRLPLEFRFDAAEVYVRKNAAGEVVLSTKPEKKPWKEIFARLDAADVPRDFLKDRDKTPAEERNLF